MIQKYSDLTLILLKKNVTANDPDPYSIVYFKSPNIAVEFYKDRDYRSRYEILFSIYFKGIGVFFWAAYEFLQNVIQLLEKNYQVTLRSAKKKRTTVVAPTRAYASMKAWPVTSSRIARKRTTRKCVETTVRAQWKKNPNLCLTPTMICKNYI